MMSYIVLYLPQNYYIQRYVHKWKFRKKIYIRLARFEWNVKTYPGKLKYIYEILIVLYNLLNIVDFVRFQLQ